MWFSRIAMSLTFVRDEWAPSLKVNYNFSATWCYGKTTFMVASTKNRITNYFNNPSVSSD